jgi:hypothetical protein
MITINYVDKTFYKESQLELAWLNDSGTKCFKINNLPPVNKNAFIAEDYDAYDTESHNSSHTVPVIQVISKLTKPQGWLPREMPEPLKAHIGRNLCWLTVYENGFGYLKLENFDRESAIDLAMRIITVFHSKPKDEVWLVEDNMTIDRKDVNL